VRHRKLRDEGVETSRLDRCNSLCNYCGAMRKVAPGGCSAIRGRMITAQEIRVRAGRKGAVAQTAAKGDGKSETLSAYLRILAAICTYLRVGAKFSREDGERQGIKRGKSTDRKGRLYRFVPLNIAWYRLVPLGGGGGCEANRRNGVSGYRRQEKPTGHPDGAELFLRPGSPHVRSFWFKVQSWEGEWKRAVRLCPDMPAYARISVAEGTAGEAPSSQAPGKSSKAPRFAFARDCPGLLAFARLARGEVGAGRIGVSACQHKPKVRLVGLVGFCSVLESAIFRGKMGKSSVYSVLPGFLRGGEKRTTDEDGGWPGKESAKRGMACRRRRSVSPFWGRKRKDYA
jgi:hypothetical protein